MLYLITHFQKNFPAVGRSGKGNQVQKWRGGGLLKEIKLVATLYNPGFPFAFPIHFLDIFSLSLSLFIFCIVFVILVDYSNLVLESWPDHQQWVTSLRGWTEAAAATRSSVRGSPARKKLVMMSENYKQDDDFCINWEIKKIPLLISCPLYVW